MAATYRRPGTLQGFTRRRWLAQAAGAVLLPAWLTRQHAQAAPYPITAEAMREFYPKLLERIRPEGHDDAMTAVNFAWATEQRHRDKHAQVRRWSPGFFEQVAKVIDKKTGQ